jgi:hypothetical protein
MQGKIYSSFFYLQTGSSGIKKSQETLPAVLKWSKFNLQYTWM